MPRILLLSYAFPPMSVPEAPLAAKRLGNLPGYTVDVICARPFRGAPDRDSSLEPYVRKRFDRIERVELPRPLQHISARHLGALGRLPDLLRLANPRALRAALRLGPHRYAAVLTWSQWHSVHLVGLALKRRIPSLPWIAHFSDPWTDNPFLRHGRVVRWLNRRLEGAVLGTADRLLFTTNETVDLMLGSRPASWRGKAHVLPHAFDPELYEPSGRHEDGTLVLRYMGQLYGRRSPEPLFRALVALCRENPEVIRAVRVEIVGRIEPLMLESDTYRVLPPGLVVHRDPVPYVESLSLMRSADLLLVIDAPSAVSVFLPSKLVDYIGAARPILGITPPGAAASVIHRYGGVVADPDDEVAVLRGLRGAIEQASAFRGRDFGDPALRSEFEIGRIGTRLGHIIDDLTLEHGLCAA